MKRSEIIFNFNDLTSSTFSITGNNIKGVVSFLFPFQYWSDLADKVKAVIKEYPMLRITQGRKVFISSFCFSYIFFFFVKVHSITHLDHFIHLISINMYMYI